MSPYRRCIRNIVEVIGQHGKPVRCSLDLRQCAKEATSTSSANEEPRHVEVFRYPLTEMRDCESLVRKDAIAEDDSYSLLPLFTTLEKRTKLERILPAPFIIRMESMLHLHGLHRFIIVRIHASRAFLHPLVICCFSLYDFE